MTWMITDLDGCISADEWRWLGVDHSIQDIDRRYHTYHALCVQDDPVNLHELIYPKRIVMTARPLRYRPQTEWWLITHKIAYDFIMMRNNADHRPSVSIKEEMLLHWLPHYGIYKDEISLAIDDHEEIVRMYRSHGLEAKVVRAGHYRRGSADLSAAQQTLR